ncbi:MAG: hypothetical protein QGG50_01915 [Methanopyri archaeon]|jgi:transposase InsO family protein|nr:hypothetical protein [Methanopyri archaeon]
MTKLTDKKISWIVKRVTRGEVSTLWASRTQSVSQRRVQQLAKEYRDTGKMPTLDPKRRPRTYVTDEQKSWIEEVWEETRLDSRLLYLELRRRGKRVPKNKLIVYLRKTGRSKPNPKKQKKRKRCRYEREHSCSLVHGDWHRRTENDPYAIAWLDNASRKILACGEFDRATGEASITTFRSAQRAVAEYRMTIREANTDRGCQFYYNKTKGTTEFQKYLGSQTIRHIVSRVNNPQTNGKIERFWLEYDRHRFRFGTFQEFAAWYNKRIHGALRTDWGENPGEAFVRKLPKEALFGLFSKMNGW